MNSLDKAETLRRLSAEEAAAHYNVSLRTICRWRGKHHVPNRRLYTPEQRAQGVALGRALGPNKAAAILGINRKTISDWMVKDIKQRCR